MADSILEQFSELPDPRRQAGRRHYLSDILALTSEQVRRVYLGR